MRDSVPSASYSSVCNVLRQWNIQLIPTYRVYRLYDKAKRNLFVCLLACLSGMAGHALYGMAPCFGHTGVTFDAENIGLILSAS